METQKIIPEIVTGPGTLEQLPDLVAKYGHKVLLVHGHRPVEDGLLEQVRQILNSKNIPHANMGQILPNPKYKSVQRGIKIARKEKCDIILSVGGGSTLQCAKGIALGLYTDKDVWHFWKTNDTVKKAGLIGAVLTNPASGQELGDSCTLVKDGKQKTISQNALECTFAVLDAKLSVLPPYPTMCQCFEMFVRSMAHYLNAKDDPKIRQGSVENIKTILESAKDLAADAKDLEARNNLFEAGLKSHQMKGSTHAVIENAAAKLAFACSLTNGSALSALFDAWMRYLEKEDKPTLENLSKDLFDKEYDKDDFTKIPEQMHLASNIPDTGLIISDHALKELTDVKEEQKLLVASNKTDHLHDDKPEQLIS
jgi:alcohol dehydrogenase YqhD (iron-dependent ADH family)